MARNNCTLNRPTSAYIQGEFYALVDELVAEEHISYQQATRRALAIFPYFFEYAADWDNTYIPLADATIIDLDRRRGV